MFYVGKSQATCDGSIELISSSSDTCVNNVINITATGLLAVNSLFSHSFTRTETARVENEQIRVD